MAEECPEHVLIRYDKMRHIRIQSQSVHQETWHEHGVLEIGLVQEGSLCLHQQGQSFPIDTDELYVINAYEPHSLKGAQENTNVLRVWLSHQFAREYFPGIANTFFSQQVITPAQGNTHRQLRQLLLEAADAYFREAPHGSLACAAALGNMVALLLRNIPYTIHSEGRKRMGMQRTGRMQRIAAYLDEHYQQRVTLAQLAEAEGLTPAYMSRIFTELFGMSFQSYLNLLRLEQALPLVKDPSVYLLDICMECGFSDTRYLNGVFRREFGISPMEYRRRYADETLSPAPAAQMPEKEN